MLHKVRSCWVSLTSVLVTGAAVLLGGLSAARHALVVEGVQVEGVGARRTAERPGPAAGAAGRVTRPTHLRGRVVVLRAQTLHAHASVQHAVRWTRRALERSLTCERRVSHCNIKVVRPYLR
jgi:hypothetical protein